MAEGSGVSEKQKPSLRLPRRSLLRGIAAFAGLAALRPVSIAEAPATEQKEKKLFSPKVTIIDAAPSVPIEGIRQQEFPNNDQLVKNVLGDKYISREQLKQEFGEDYDSKWGQIIDKYPQTMMYQFTDIYLNHGENVAKVMNRMWDIQGLKADGVDLIPLQKIFDAQSVRFGYTDDELKNPKMTITFDAKKIIDLLKQDTNRVVNMSFQVGDVDLIIEKKRKEIPEVEHIDAQFPQRTNRDEGDEITDGLMYLGKAEGYTSAKDSNGNNIFVPTDSDGNILPTITQEQYQQMQKQKQDEAERNTKIVEAKYPKMKIIGAYSKEKARENLPKLFEVCDSYPDKLFIVAAGNNGEDLREALDELSDKRSKNLIIVAQWGGYGDFPTHYVNGADLYVDNQKINADNGEELVPSGSSFSTPVVSYDAALFDPGLSSKELQDRILRGQSDREYLLSDNSKQPAKVWTQGKG